MTAPVTGLLLAAGSARRFGSNKMLARLPHGECVGVQTARRVAGAVDALLVVVRCGDAATRSAFAAAGFDVIDCPDADLGMGHSLRYGVLQSKRAAAWVVALGDMPYLEARTVRQAVARFRQTNAIIVPRCGERAGHPVVFPARFYAALVELSGDSGARAIIDAHAADVEWLDTEDAGVLRDIDAPEDLADPT